MGNGIANIIAALIVAGALVWNGGFGNDKTSSGIVGSAADSTSDEEFAKWYARAVGDIRNDIVVNCGCCGDEKGTRRAGGDSF